jgi:hypothetical protein
LPDDGTGVRKVGLTRGMVALVDAGDYERVAKFNWYAFPSNPPGRFYAVRGANVGGRYRNIFLHQEVTGIEARRVDHANHDGLDNRRENLRICGHHENMRNRRKLAKKTSKYKGVSFNKEQGLWWARISIGALNPKTGKRRQIVVCRSESELKAAAAYDRAAREHFGEFALTNGV